MTLGRGEGDQDDILGRGEGAGEDTQWTGDCVGRQVDQSHRR